MDSMLQTMLHCSADQAGTLVSAYRDETGWHAETVIGAAGALLGYAIQSSAYSMAAQGTGSVLEFERPTNPPFGKFVDCNERISLFLANEYALLGQTGEQLGWFGSEALPEMPAIVQMYVAQMGGEWFPRLSVATEHMPRDWSPDAVPQFAQQMRNHLDRHKLPRNVCEVLTLTLALGYLVDACRDRLDPAIALRIGLETAVATAHIGNLDRRHTVFAPDGAFDELSDDNPSLAAGDSALVHEEMAHEPVGSAAAVSCDDMGLREEDASETADAGTSKAKVIFMESVPVGDLASTEEAVRPDDITFATEPEVMADALDMDDVLPTPRASRLVRTRHNRTAFGKRQFG